MKVVLQVLSLLLVALLLAGHVLLVWMWIQDLGIWLAPPFWVLGIWSVVSVKPGKLPSRLMFAILSGVGMGASSFWFQTTCLRHPGLCGDGRNPLGYIAVQTLFYCLMWAAAVTASRYSKSREP